MVHPLVRVHPDTNRKCLFLGMHASHIDGQDIKTSRPVIVSLEEHSTQEQFTFRHHWKDGDILMWIIGAFFIELTQTLMLPNIPEYYIGHVCEVRQQSLPNPTCKK